MAKAPEIIQIRFEDGKSIPVSEMEKIVGSLRSEVLVSFGEQRSRLIPYQISEVNSRGLHIRRMRA